MSAITHPWHPCYELYIRHRDRAMRLVEQKSGKPVAIAATMPSIKDREGLFIRPREGITVYLMDDEIKYVSELPEGSA